MLKLRVVQAEEGDSLILVYGTAANPRYALIDGGPAGVYENDLRSELQAIAADGGALDLVVLSHVDNDHVLGLLDFFTELRDTPDGEDPLIALGAGGLWHNAFNATVDRGGGLAPRLAQMARTARHRAAGATVLGIGQGGKLAQLSRLLRVKINAAFKGKPIVVKAGQTPLALGNLAVHVVGPTAGTLKALRDEWARWLDKQEASRNRPRALAMLDKSIPNLSSISLVVADGKKRLLLTGDARGDHLLDGLAQAGLLEEDETIHVDVFKLPHHGSDRNVSRELFERITADTYVISANGKHGNPDVPALEWIVQSSRAAGRRVKLVLTNTTPDVKRFQKAHPPGSWGYSLEVLGKSKSSLDVVVRA